MQSSKEPSNKRPCYETEGNIGIQQLQTGYTVLSSNIRGGTYTWLTAVLSWDEKCCGEIFQGEMVSNLLCFYFSPLYFCIFVFFVGMWSFATLSRRNVMLGKMSVFGEERVYLTSFVRIFESWLFGKLWDKYVCWVNLLDGIWWELVFRLSSFWFCCGYILFLCCLSR